MKKIIREIDGKHIVVRKSNDWEYHIKIYRDGIRQEWFKKN